MESQQTIQDAKIEFNERAQSCFTLSLTFLIFGRTSRPNFVQSQG